LETEVSMLGWLLACATTMTAHWSTIDSIAGGGSPGSFYVLSTSWEQTVTYGTVLAPRVLDATVLSCREETYGSYLTVTCIPILDQAHVEKAVKTGLPIVDNIEVPKKK